MTRGGLLPAALAAIFAWACSSSTPSSTATSPPDLAAPLSASFGRHNRTFDHGAYGTTASTDGGAPTIHFEAYVGGQPGCPTDTSPSPDATFVVTNIAPPALGAAQTNTDGAHAEFYDFTGDLVAEPAVSASALRVVPRSVGRLGVDALTLEIDATFTSGSVKGTIGADHCASLDLGP